MTTIQSLSPTTTYTVFINELNLEFTYPESVGVWRVNSNTIINDFTLNHEEEVNKIKNQHEELTPAENFINNIKQIDIMPFNKAEIRYSSDLWDFSKYSTLNIKKTCLKYDFSKCNTIFRDDLKKFLLLIILENKTKFQTIKQTFYKINKFLNYVAQNNYYHVTDISDEIIIQYLDGLNNPTVDLLRRYKRALKAFFLTYSINFGVPLTKERLQLFDFNDYHLYAAHKRQARIKNIPDDYFDNLISTLVKTADNKDLSRETRALAALYIIISQTGIRIGEALGLKAGCLQEITIFEDTQAYFFNFQTWKREKGNNTATWQKAYANPLSKKAYDVLMEIEQPRREKFGVKYLYTGNERIKKSTFPLSSSIFLHYTQKVMLQLDGFECIDLPESKTQGFRRTKIRKKENNKMVDTGHYFVFPHCHQFRVHVCTELINRGVPLKYVQKFMTHLSSEMTTQYYQENKEAEELKRVNADKMLRMMINGETKPIGAKGDSLVEDIDKFIKKGNYNIATDMDEIISKLNDSLVINPKTGGLCIKSPLLRCSVEGKSNEYYCAYNVCPNLYDFFYMADIAYRQCKELSEAIEINTKNGYMRESQKQCNMLNTICSSKLIPELDELEKVIKKKGVEYVLENYPDLSEIIENFQTIRMEAKEWKTKSML